MFDFQFAGYLLLSKGELKWSNRNKVEECNFVPPDTSRQKSANWDIRRWNLHEVWNLNGSHPWKIPDQDIFFWIYFIQNITQNNMRVFIPIRSSKLQDVYRSAPGGDENEESYLEYGFVELIFPEKW